jgi:hypothetical protein
MNAERIDGPHSKQRLATHFPLLFNYLVIEALSQSVINWINTACGNGHNHISIIRVDGGSALPFSMAEIRS